MHLMGVQQIWTTISKAMLPDITMVSWKFLTLAAARWQAIPARGKHTEVIADQVIKSRGRWLENIAR